MTWIFSIDVMSVYTGLLKWLKVWFVAMGVSLLQLE